MMGNLFSHCLYNFIHHTKLERRETWTEVLWSKKTQENTDVQPFIEEHNPEGFMLGVSRSSYIYAAPSRAFISISCCCQISSTRDSMHASVKKSVNQCTMKKQSPTHNYGDFFKKKVNTYSVYIHVIPDVTFFVLGWAGFGSAFLGLALAAEVGGAFGARPPLGGSCLAWGGPDDCFSALSEAISSGTETQDERDQKLMP